MNRALPTKTPLQLPDQLTLLEGKLVWVKQDPVMVLPSGKIKRPRLEPGNFFRHSKQLFEVRYVYRLQEHPGASTEWLYACDYRTEISENRPDDLLGQTMQEMNAECNTKLVVPQIFLQERDVRSYFVNVYHASDGKIFTNKEIASGADLVSSGEIYSER